MKETPKIIRVKLKTERHDEFILLGIVSHEPDYKLSLALNKKLKISLRNRNPVITYSGPDNELIFSRFSDTSSSPELIYDLISNRSGKSYLLKKLKNVDYIFRIYDPQNSVKTDDITVLLREIECVSGVFILNPATIRDRNLYYLLN